MNKITKIQELRAKIRSGAFRGHTSGVLPELAQANLVIIPKENSGYFSDFCRLNSTPCPVIFKGAPGQYLLDELGAINIKTDVPAYWVYRHGRMVEERDNIVDIWEDDMVVFCLGCSFTFEQALIKAGIKMPHIQAAKNVAMYKTNIDLEESGPFKGKMVVSMRWIPKALLEKARQVTACYPRFHGAPLHAGNPKEIGIADLAKPDFGDYVSPTEDCTPVFWGCGVTPQVCIQQSKLDLVITHKPGSMLITDLKHDELLERI